MTRKSISASGIVGRETVPDNIQSVKVDERVEVHWDGEQFGDGAWISFSNTDVVDPHD